MEGKVGEKHSGRGNDGQKALRKAGLRRRKETSVAKAQISRGKTVQNKAGPVGMCQATQP